MKKIRTLSLILVLVLSLGILAACGSNTTTTPPATPPATPPVTTPGTGTGEDTEFTLEELAKYNGKDGNRAYVAVDGVVYDVTDVKEWAGGSHWGKFQAGNDLTDAIKTQSPHGVAKLTGVPVVGKLVTK